MNPRYHLSARALEIFDASALPKSLVVHAATAERPAEILLYDEIGYFGVTAKAFVGAMASAGAGPIRVRINSPGGDVFDGVAIANAMKAHPGGVTTQVDGLAASAASFIALAGARMEMADTSMFMIHCAWSVSFGNKTDMRTTADLLEKIDGQIADMYAAKTGGDLADIAAAMCAETWYTAKEAEAAGYCDAIVSPPKAKNQAAAPVAAAETVVADAVIEPVATVDPLAAQKRAVRLRIAVAQE
jgi:ATP-dependent Clp protease protease subunit